jgi:hypothetical protein
VFIISSVQMCPAVFPIDFTSVAVILSCISCFNGPIFYYRITNLEGTVNYIALFLFPSKFHVV